MSDQKNYSVDDILEDISRSRGDAPRAESRQTDVDRILEEVLHKKKTAAPVSAKQPDDRESVGSPGGEPPAPVPQVEQIRKAVEQKVSEEFPESEKRHEVLQRKGHHRKSEDERPVTIRADAYLRAKRAEEQQLRPQEDLGQSVPSPQPAENVSSTKPEQDDAPEKEKVAGESRGNRVRNRPVYLSDLFVGDREEFLAERRAEIKAAEEPKEEPAETVAMSEPDPLPGGEEPVELVQEEVSTEIEKKKFVIDGDAVERTFAQTRELPPVAEPEKTAEPVRKERKIRDFVLMGEEEEDEPEEEETVEEIEEYESREDEPAVWADIRMLRLKLVVRAAVLLVLSLFSVFLLLGNAYPALMPDALNASVQPLTYLLANFLSLGVAAAVSYSVVGGGIVSAVRLRPDRDSMLSLAVLASFIQMVACFFDTSSLLLPNVDIYAGIAVIGLLFNTFGKLLFVKNVSSNFRYLTSPYDKYALQVLDNEQVSVEMTRGLVDDFPFVAIRKKAGFLEHFISRSNEEDSSDRLARFLLPISLGCSLIFGAVCLLKGNNIFAALSVFTVVCCAFVPFGYLLSVSVPMYRAARKLKKFGGVLLDTTEVEDYYDVNAVTTTAHELFPEGAVQLFGIKTFSGTRIDEALLDAASVIHSSGGILYDVFSEILAGDENLLRPVDTLVYEDAMGVSAWVNNKRVLIGSRELMINHGIRVPSKDYEMRYLNEGHELIYLSTSGDLTAVFLVKLEAAPQVEAALKKLAFNDIKVVVKTVDAVVTRQKLADLFGVSPELFKIIPARLHEEYDRLNAESERVDSSVASSEGFFSFVNTLAIVKRLHTVLSLSSVIQVAAIILGLILVALFALIFTSGSISPFSLLIYQLVWMVATIVIPMIKSL